MRDAPPARRREGSKETPSEGGRGVGRRRSRRLRAECRCRCVEAAPLATAQPRAAVLFSCSRRLVTSGRTGRASPIDENPSVVEGAGRPRRWITPLQGQAHSGSQGPVATKHRSPARPHDASRSPLGSGGTGRSIGQVSGAGIDWGAIPASPGRPARPSGEHPRLECGIRSRT